MRTLYPYEVNCFREGDRWFEGSGINGVGVGWSPRRRSDDGRSLGVLRLSGEVRSGVREVVVECEEREHRLAVSGGYFFFTEWDAPADFQDTLGRPRAVHYVYDDGTEEAVQPDPLLERAWDWMRGTNWPEPSLEGRAGLNRIE